MAAIFDILARLVTASKPSTYKSPSGLCVRAVGNNQTENDLLRCSPRLQSIGDNNGTEILSYRPLYNLTLSFVRYTICTRKAFKFTILLTMMENSGYYILIS